MIDSLSWGPIRGGLLHGKMAFHIGYAELEDDGFEDAEIAFKVFNTRRGASKIVAFYDPPDNTATIAKSFRDAGYEIMVLTTVPIFRLWYDPRIVNYLILEITMKPWAAFVPNEIRYRPDPDNDILEPPLPPEIENANCAIYIYESERYPEVMQFIANSKNKWGLIPDGGPAVEDLMKE